MTVFNTFQRERRAGNHQVEKLPVELVLDMSIAR